VEFGQPVEAKAAIMLQMGEMVALVVQVEVVQVMVGQEIQD
jgi:hypothetical protein